MVKGIIPYRKGIQIFVQARLVVDTLEKYMASSDDTISLVHVPFYRRHPTDGTMESLETEMREVGKRGNGQVMYENVCLIAGRYLRGCGRVRNARPGVGGTPCYGQVGWGTGP
jgi:hypothetical protein